MTHEKSCGAVIYTQKGRKRLYLLEYMQKGHISLCKGHVEGDEYEQDTAAREIFEETGLTVQFIYGFRETIEYSPREGCMKTVIFFLAKARTTEVKAQEEEVKEIRWLPFKEAVETLTHESDRETLRKAEWYLGLKFKKGYGWRACYDDTTGIYTAERRGPGYHHIYEITKDIYDAVANGMSDDDVYKIFDEGRHLYYDCDDRCGPPYTIVFDDDYGKICPWAVPAAPRSVWPAELTDAAVEIFESEKNNREQRRRKRAEREKRKEQEENS